MGTLHIHILSATSDESVLIVCTVMIWRYHADT